VLRCRCGCARYVSSRNLLLQQPLADTPLELGQRQRTGVDKVSQRAYVRYFFRLLPAASAAARAAVADGRSRCLFGSQQPCVSPCTCAVSRFLRSGSDGGGEVEEDHYPLNESPRGGALDEKIMTPAHATQRRGAAERPRGRTKRRSIDAAVGVWQGWPAEPCTSHTPAVCSGIGRCAARSTVRHNAHRSTVT
jgi:hypothetical protein